MATPPEKLAASLEELRKLQTTTGTAAIRARHLSRTHRERLLANGFLTLVIKDWYIPGPPDELKCESSVPGRIGAKGPCRRAVAGGA